MSAPVTVRSGDLADYPFGVVVSSQGSVQVHMDPNVLRLLPFAERKAIVSALRDAVDSLSKFLRVVDK
jgi:hypothetical protein